MAINAQRWFMRKEEYEVRKALPDSPFRKFDVKCLRCRSYKLTLTAHYDEESGEPFVLLSCTCCRQQEKLPVKF